MILASLELRFQVFMDRLRLTLRKAASVIADLYLHYQPSYRIEQNRPMINKSGDVVSHASKPVLFLIDDITTTGANKNVRIKTSRST